jgi:hypothetical protein
LTVSWPYPYHRIPYHATLAQDEHARTVSTACVYEAKLAQLTSRKGFTGSAKEVDDTASGSGAGSKHTGKPGFKWVALLCGR